MSSNLENGDACGQLDESSLSNSTIMPPKDTFNIAYFIYFALGMGFLLPWNAFITAVDYFDYLYPNTQIDRVFSLAYIIPCFPFLLLLIFYGRGYSSSIRINCGLGLFLVTILVVPIMDELAIGDTRGNSITHYVTIGAVACTGIANGVVQGSLVGAAGELPERYMQALVGGTAASGVLVSLLRILTKAALPKSSDGLRQSSNLYFLVSAIFIVLCIVLQTFVHRLPVNQFYKTLDASISASTPLLQGEKPTVSALERPPKHSQVYSVSLAEIKGSKMSWTPVRYWQTLKQIQGLVLSLTFIYVVTLSIFPGFITENVHSIKLGDWYPILLITTYNVSDLLGKMFTAFYVVKDKATVEVMCIARILFFPLFASCLHGSAFMHTEAAVFISTLLLGVTNGYLSSVIMMSTPKMVAFQDAEVAGIIVVVFLLTGIAAGSILGWVWVI